MPARAWRFKSSHPHSLFSGFLAIAGSPVFFCVSAYDQLTFNSLVFHSTGIFDLLNTTVGTEIDFVEKLTDKDNIMWLRSKWSKDNNKNWGVRMDRLEEVKEPEEPEPTPEPPIDVDPEEPGNGDQVDYPNWFVRFITELIEWLSNKIRRN